MTKVDFYTGSADKLRTACQLSHKAMQHGMHTVISLPDEASCDALDKLLWQYPDTAFIPHARSNPSTELRTGPSTELITNDLADVVGQPSRMASSSTRTGLPECPIVLSCDSNDFPHYDMLISLHNECMPFFSRFERVAEIVGTDEKDSRLGRERFKFYRDRGYELRHFDLARTNQP